MAIQKVWNRQLGESSAPISEEVMHKSHALLVQSREEALRELGGLTVAQYLGETWVRAHPEVMACVQALEDALR